MRRRDRHLISQMNCSAGLATVSKNSQSSLRWFSHCAATLMSLFERGSVRAGRSSRLSDRRHCSRARFGTPPASPSPPRLCFLKKRATQRKSRRRRTQTGLSCFPRGTPERIPCGPRKLGWRDAVARLAGFVAGRQKARGFGTPDAAAESRFFRVARSAQDSARDDRIQGRAEFYRGGCNRLEQSRSAWVAASSKTSESLAKETQALKSSEPAAGRRAFPASSTKRLWLTETRATLLGLASKSEKCSRCRTMPKDIDC